MIKVMGNSCGIETQCWNFFRTNVYMLVVLSSNSKPILIGNG